jgi:hypothetical protein
MAASYRFPPPGSTSIQCVAINKANQNAELLKLDVVGQNWRGDEKGSPLDELIHSIDQAPDRQITRQSAVRSGAAQGKGAYYIKKCDAINSTVVQIRSTEASKLVTTSGWLALLQDAISYFDSLGPCRSASPSTTSPQPPRS